MSDRLDTKGQTCNRCGAPIAFVRTAATGAAMPLDPTPAARGNVHILLQGGELKGHVRTGRHREELQADGTPLYLAHFASCPNR